MALLRGRSPVPGSPCRSGPGSSSRSIFLAAMRIPALLGITLFTLPVAIQAGAAEQQGSGRLARQLPPAPAQGEHRRKGTGTWCYDSQDPKCGPLHWKDITAHCGGKNQSPIDINRRKAQRDKNLDEILFEGYDQAPSGRWRLLNDGHTVIMNLDGASTAEQINITRGGLDDIYRALQFHFHWGDLSRNGSEHTIDGKQYPMELHVVHMNAKYKTSMEAKGHPNGLAVLSFLFKASDADNTNYNTIVAGLKNISRPEEYVDLASTFPLSNLLPSMGSLSKYYRYKGSLTTPTCDEVVAWTVFEEQIPISRPQLNAFADTLYFKNTGATPQKMSNNFRSPQPLNSRKVFASRDATISGGSSLDTSLLLLFALACLAGWFSGPS